MPQACIPRSAKGSLSKQTCHQFVSHVGSQILHLQTCPDFHPLLEIVGQMAMAVMEISQC